MTIDWPSLSDKNYSSDTPLLQREDTSDLFDMNAPVKDRSDISFVHSLPHPSQRCCKISGAIKEFENLPIREIEARIDSFDFVLYDLAEPVLFSGTDSSIERAIAKFNWQRLVFSPQIVDSIKSFSSAFNLSKSVAVHVRRGDLINKLINDPIDLLLQSGATEIFQRYIPVKTIVNILSKDFPDLNSCIICSESHEVVHQLEQLAPGLSFVQTTAAFAQNCNQRALLDLLILSKAACIVSPFKSYFSTCAETVGDCKLINSGLDIPNLVEELSTALDALDLPDQKTRKAIVYAYGFLNLWYEPNSDYRHTLKDLTMAEDPDIGRVLLGSNP